MRSARCPDLVIVAQGSAIWLLAAKNATGATASEGGQGGSAQTRCIVVLDMAQRVADRSTVERSDASPVGVGRRASSGWQEGTARD